MKPQVGDILAWKHWRGVASADLDEYFLVIEIDKENSEPYLVLNLTRGGYERLNGKGFKDKLFWEKVA